MSTDNEKGFEVISRGDLVMLRTLVKTDRDHYQRWQTEGEWLDLVHYGMLREEWETKEGR